MSNHFRSDVGEALSSIFFDNPEWAAHYYRSVSTVIDKYGEKAIPEFNEFFIACYSFYKETGSKWTFEEAQLHTMKKMKEKLGEVH